MILRTHVKVREQGGKWSLSIRVFITPPTESLQHKGIVEVSVAGLVAIATRPATDTSTRHADIT